MPAPEPDPRESVDAGGFTIDDVVVHAEGEGPETLLFVHGWPDTWRLWDAQVAALKHRWRCLRFTLPGFEPGTPRRAVPLAQIVDLLRRIALRAGGPVTLVVHDWGAVFGYRFAMQHPELVSRLVGVDVGDAGSRENRAALSARHVLMIAAYQLWLIVAWRIGGALGDALARRMARWLRAPGDLATVHAGMGYPYDIAWTGSHGGYRGAPKLEPPMPMLFVYGERKPFFFHSKEWAERIAARPGNRVVALPTGHWVMKRPELFNPALIDWLERTPSAEGEPTRPGEAPTAGPSCPPAPGSSSGSPRGA